MAVCRKWQDSQALKLCIITQIIQPFVCVKSWPEVCPMIRPVGCITALCFQRRAAENSPDLLPSAGMICQLVDKRARMRLKPRSLFIFLCLLGGWLLLILLN